MIKKNKIFLHFPQKKTGTSYLQKILYMNRLYFEKHHKLVYSHNLNKIFYKNFNELNGNGWFLKELLTKKNSEKDLTVFFKNYKSFFSKELNYLFSTEHININEIETSNLTLLKKNFEEIGFETHIIFCFRNPIEFCQSLWKQQFNNPHLKSKPLDIQNLYKINTLYFDTTKIDKLKLLFNKNFSIINYDKNKYTLLKVFLKILKIRLKFKDIYIETKQINSSFSNLEALIANEIIHFGGEKFLKHLRLLKMSNTGYFKETNLNLNINENELEKLINRLNCYFNLFNKFKFNKIIKKINNQSSAIPIRLQKIIFLFKKKIVTKKEIEVIYNNCITIIEYVILLIFVVENLPSLKNKIVKKLIDLDFLNDSFLYYQYRYYKFNNSPKNIIYYTKLMNVHDRFYLSKLKVI
jgi:hypothetical protein